MTTTTDAPATTATSSTSPDAQTTWVVTVRNDGLVVDSFAFEPIGTLADRAVVEPAELGLLPGQESQVTVRYDLPTEPPLAAGSHPVGLRVVSREDPGSGYVEEGALDIAPFTAVTAELGPRTSTARGRGKGKHEVALDNRGNTTAVVVLDLADPDEKVHGTIEPAFVEVGPGRSELVTVKVHARAQHWKGANNSLPFQVVVTPPEGDQRTLPGTLLQRAVLPSWLLKALLGLLVLAMLMSGLWLAVLRPAIESSARAAASEEGAKALAAQEEAAAAQEKAAAEQKAGAGRPVRQGRRPDAAGHRRADARPERAGRPARRPAAGARRRDEDRPDAGQGARRRPDRQRHRPAAAERRRRHRTDRRHP